MRIRKQYQVIPTNAKLENGHSTSSTNGYTCEYINGLNEYSADEIRIGTWINGKPIYRKTFKVTDTSLTTPSSLLIGTVSNIDDIVCNNCIVKFKNGPWALMPFTSMQNNVYNINNFQSYYVIIGTDGKININPQFASSVASTQNLDKVIVIIEYTKTTDA